MTASENLRDNVNLLMQGKKWTANKQLIAASDGRLSNGTLGRIRGGKGENTKLSQVEALAEVFEMEPHQLLAPPKINQGGLMKNGWPLPPELLAALQNADAKTLRRAQNALMSALDMDLVPAKQAEESHGAA